MFLRSRVLENVLGVRNRPIRTVLWWQVCTTGVLALVAGPVAGRHAAFSALLGGLVSILAGWVYAVVGALGGRKHSAGAALAIVLQAEAAKILAIVAGLAAVLTTYRDVVAPAFLGTFVLTTLVFATAIFIREQ